MASAGAVIRSWHGGSTNRARRVRRSLIQVDLVDLAVCNFEHCSDLIDFWRLLEPGELIGGHAQVGAWRLVDVMAVDKDKFVVEVVLEWAWPPLRAALASTMAASFARRCTLLVFLLT